MSNDTIIIIVKKIALFISTHYTNSGELDLLVPAPWASPNQFRWRQYNGK